MKFKDIPQLTSVGSYQINMPLTSVVRWINEHIDDMNLQLNPDFQRGHVWTEDQQIKYIEYLLKGGKSARVIYFNHAGWMDNWEGEFVCVDGLQRLTAVQRFMNNEIKAFGYYYKDFEDKPRNIDLLFNVNNLKTRKEVLQWYIEFNSGGTVHTEDEINRVKKMLEEEQEITQSNYLIERLSIKDLNRTITDNKNKKGGFKMLKRILDLLEQEEVNIITEDELLELSMLLKKMLEFCEVQLTDLNKKYPKLFNDKDM